MGMGSRESPAQTEGDGTKKQDHNGLHDLEDVEDISELNQSNEGQTAMGSWVLLVDEKDEQTNVTGEDVIISKEELVGYEEIEDGYVLVKIDQGIEKEEEKKNGILIAGSEGPNNEDFDLKPYKGFIVKLYEDYFGARCLGSVQKEENIEKENENEVSVGEIIEGFKKEEVEEKEKTNQFDKGVLYEMESTSLFGNGRNDPLEECRRYYEERMFLESRVALLKQEVSLLEKKTSRRTVSKKPMEIRHQLMQDYIKFLIKCCRGSIKMIMELLKNYAPIEQIERQIRQLERQVEHVRSTTDPELWGNMK